MTNTSQSIPERFAGITRPYTTADVDRLRARYWIEHTVARPGAQRLREPMRTDGYVPALGAMTGATRPCNGSARACRPSMSAAGRSPPAPTPPARCAPFSRWTP
ncbi:MAG: hypothetical protein FJ137_04230 [Deltaproteobacteria bacterium]|nr:hypothetical protein [Deltaproteobacteria bacterium]